MANSALPPISDLSADGMLDTLIVSGTVGGVADGLYARGLGVNAYMDRYPLWLKVGGTSGDYVKGSSEIYSGGVQFAYTDTPADTRTTHPWQMTPASWLLTLDDSPNAAIVGVAPQSMVLDQRAVVVGVDNSTELGTDPGTAAAKGTSLANGDTATQGGSGLQRLIFYTVGGSGTSDAIIPNGSGDGWTVVVGGDEVYITSEATEFPWQATAWVSQFPGVNPAPTVTQGYSTAQYLLDQLEAQVAAITPQVDGVIKQVKRTFTGSTAGGGKLIVDLTALTPPLSGATMIGWTNDEAADPEKVSMAQVTDDTSSTFTVQFYQFNLVSGFVVADDVRAVTFTIAADLA